MRVLIVEDEVKIRTGMGNLIEHATKHHIVGEGKNGVEGIELAIRLKPDLIITDIRMPQMDGLEMIYKLRQQDVQSKFIILTGYAEFDYAKKAIELGVDDYLLKPIGVEDVEKALTKIADEMREENHKKKGLPTVLRDIYLGDAEAWNEQSIKMFIQENQNLFPVGCKQEGTVSFQVYLGYIGAAQIQYKKAFMEKWEQLTNQKEVAGVVADIDKLREILCFVCGTPKQLVDFQNAFEEKILKHSMQNQKAIWGEASGEQLEELYQKMQEAQATLEYGLVMREDELLTQEHIAYFHEEEFVFPVLLENKVKNAICNGKLDEMKIIISEFISYMEKHLFLPQYIKHCYLRFFTYIANILQEIDQAAFEKMQSKYYMKQFGDARTLYELETVLAEVSNFLEGALEKKEDIHNYTIRRAINYIREHYKEGITLEETASKLMITPEYLSTLFYKEMEINFSTFLKEFRISHAKRLLKGTNMRIYEIAEEVGYHDPKYFMRVFKEVQGISPKEYREK